ncbi:membrane protein insertase YidC [Undibacterium arcticum]|uniref:Membrane protein insertase YidC n=1 Tax=Undibacterium arcticum TaxID=1762892 RepID=A0ABV7F0B3_9BURK
MDIKRTVLWVVFSLSILLLWDNWMRSSGKPSMFFPTANQQAKGPASASTSDVPQASAVSGAPASAAATGAVSTDTTPIKGETIAISTDLVKVEINTAGGELTHLELLKHKGTVDQKSNLVLFDNSPNHTYLAETGLIGGANGVTFPNHKTLFTAKPGPRTLDGNNEVKLVLEAEQGGLKLTKTFTFKRGDYVIDVKHEVTNTGTAPVAPSLYLQLVRDGNKPEGESRFYSTFSGPALYTEADKFQKLNFEKIEKGTEEHATKADNGWIALVQHYFVSAFIPRDKTAREIFTKKVANNLYAIGTVEPLGTIAPGATVSKDAALYSGPQESAALEKTAPGLVLVKDYGWATIIAQPIFWVLEQLHKVLGNWGWTIIAFTVLIKLLFFPLSAASFRSMAKMKLVTPKMTEIRERHKSDPQKMNQAMMALYKTEKINPLGGCLPILIQMPVFMALYWVLSASVEMRGAPWLGWIHNLAAPDPWYILPVIYAVSMFIQTKLNPAPADPMQAKMMLFMPLAFSVMFFFFPAGLVLYWVVNNVLSIGQQWVITKKMTHGRA